MSSYWVWREVGVQCVNFPWESIQLTEADVGNFSDIAFGDRTKLNASSPATTSACKAFPGSFDWPIDDEWNQLNSSLGGALLKPSPPAAVCYSGPQYDLNQCNYILQNASSSRFYLDDPLTVLTSWPEGDTCYPTLSPTQNCTQGGFPVYVVNATNVKQIQIAVNFARNRNIRLVIKNTGHDFNGRSTGAGSLSIWTHYLKSFEFLPEYTEKNYSNIAARVSAGLEAWEMYQYMDKYNMTLVSPGGFTVGPHGGWMAGGGHSTIGSIYGLGSDQPLSLNVVTADGKFVTADMDTNPDLYYALRGGGPGTYGIVTSAIVKAYPPIHVSETTLAFNGGPVPIFNVSAFGNFTLPINFTFPLNFTLPPPPASTLNTSAFWEAVNLYHAYGKPIVDVGGTAYSYITKTGNGSFSFTTNIEMAGMNASEAFTFLTPLYTAIQALGIPVNQTLPVTSLSWGSTRQGEGDAPGDQRFASRLFPYSNWEDETLFNNTMVAIREVVEQGYTFHGVNIKPDEKAAGYPGNAAVNPAFRRTIMHADIFDNTLIRGATREVVEATHVKLNNAMDLIRAATPNGGSYVNEADVQEPNWQQSFFGDNYNKLLKIKRERDPWGLFYAPTTVGSEVWEVRTADGLPTQNGKLCKVKQVRLESI
ncbi:FAD-binding domain-containing protein [Mollisia scopiformis]|uniref:FAD-binding domain-containing protein n=1 Tax=Mollisia scopiformis TaxID=149040 RepID=A0A194XN47_MOLSC|nr:FAD-binding domain-containing protein [Mollisia scopiformis]KUJ21514.1 FAD-binding domain-containing protein [Mollisia scopiformis]